MWNINLWFTSRLGLFSFPRNYTIYIKTYVHMKTCTQIFKAALCIIDQTWKHSKCPSRHKWNICFQYKNMWLTVHTLHVPYQEIENKWIWETQNSPFVKSLSSVSFAVKWHLSVQIQQPEAHHFIANKIPHGISNMYTKLWQ